MSYVDRVRKIVAWTGVFALFTGAGAISNPDLKPSFADLTWYSSRQAVKQKMLSRGYTFQIEDKKTGATDSIYTGKILGMKARIRTYFNNLNQLVKTSIIFENDYSSNIYNNWKIVKDNLDGKYGQGIDLSNIDKNYTSDNIMLGIELDRGKELNAQWIFPKNGYGIYLEASKILIGDNNYYLNMGYESPAWGKELSRRRNGGDL